MTQKGARTMKTSKRAAALLISLVMALFCFTGCTKAERVNILYDTETLYIEREGAKTRVYDRIGEARYTFTSHRVRVRQDQSEAERQSKDKAQTAADTDTIKIQTVHNIIIVTDRTTGEVYYFNMGG